MKRITKAKNFRHVWGILFGVVLAWGAPVHAGDVPGVGQAGAAALPVNGTPLPDTGQTQSYTTTFGEDSDYLINPPSYTKLDGNGNDLPDTATEWSMVRDNVTQLIWEVKTEDATIHDKDNTFTWQNAQDVFPAALNAEIFGGWSDWRMPTIRELNSITDMGKYNPAINTDYFPNTLSSNYWSSTTSASFTNCAWPVSFNNGNDYGNYYKSNSYYVRAVRSGQSRLFDHLVINGDGTVTDTVTGLMWQRSSSVYGMNWENALGYSENLSLAGYDDWRLPNKEELRSIVDYSRSGPAINTAYFSDTLSSYYWSATTNAYYTDRAWIVYFNLGGDNYGGYKSGSYYVRAVRSGQSRVLDHLVISSPIQGSVWGIGDTLPIRWDTAGLGGNVAVSLSRQGGKAGTFETLVAATENDGAYDCIVSGAYSVNCVLRIEPAADQTKGTSQGLFSVLSVPVLTTTAVSAITTSGAASGGNITSEGGLSVTGRGVCWSTWENPTISDNKTSDGAGDGSFTSAITGLSAGAAYHVRAYATNNVGTGYGSDVSFNTSYAATLYVNSSGNCGDKTPCYGSIQSAVNVAVTGSAIRIARGTYTESITLNESKILTLQGGWDASYDQQTSNASFIKAPRALQGALKMQMVTITP